jgi:hypothetical protein
VAVVIRSLGVYMDICMRRIYIVILKYIFLPLDVE